MSNFVTTVAELETICGQTAITRQAVIEGFWPTAKQIYFFSLVWLLKHKVAFQRVEDPLNGQEAAALLNHAQQVAQHLDEWGATVAALKRREAKAWELLRIQMEKAIKYYHYQQEDMKADVLQEALLKIFNLLKKMVEGCQLEKTRDILGLVVNDQTNLTNIYDFSSPFYAFAKRVARNELISQLRKENRQPVYPSPLEEMDFAMPAVPPPPLPEDEQTLIAAHLWQLELDLTRLLEFIESSLTPKPRQVVCQTLAAQPQFWRILTLTGLARPRAFPPRSNLSSDDEIAAALHMSANSVRASRSQAKKRIQEVDPILGLLFERLITRRDGGGWRESRQ